MSRESVAAGLQISGVRKRYPEVTALDGVSLDIREGEFVTLLGPSGCGKTTLLRVVAGFEWPDEGTVILDGRDITRLPPYRRPVNTVFQKPVLLPHLDVFENVAFGLRAKRVPRASIHEKVTEMLETMCFRFRGHFEGDTDHYRKSAVKRRMREEGDPLSIARHRLMERGEADEATLARMEEEIQAEIRDILRNARKAPAPDAGEALKDVFAE